MLINAAECEPYITADHREMLENSERVIDGMFAVAKYLDIKRIIIGIESNKPDAIKLIKEKLASDPRNKNGHGMQSLLYVLFIRKALKEF